MPLAASCTLAPPVAATAQTPVAPPAPCPPGPPPSATAGSALCTLALWLRGSCWAASRALLHWQHRTVQRGALQRPELQRTQGHVLLCSHGKLVYNRKAWSVCNSAKLLQLSASGASCRTLFCRATCQVAACMPCLLVGCGLRRAGCCGCGLREPCGLAGSIPVCFRLQAAVLRLLREHQEAAWLLSLQAVEDTHLVGQACLLRSSGSSAAQTFSCGIKGKACLEAGKTSSVVVKYPCNRTLQ